MSIHCIHLYKLKEFIKCILILLNPYLSYLYNASIAFMRHKSYPTSTTFSLLNYIVTNLGSLIEQCSDLKQIIQLICVRTFATL